LGIKKERDVLKLEIIKRTNKNILQDMAVHYSQPKGFVGRNICYAVMFNDGYMGAIVGGSATKHLPGRNDFFDNSFHLNQIVNNIFFHVEPENGKYPIRNFTKAVLKEYRKRIQDDWFSRYGDIVIGHETLIELPRTGEAYKRDGWKLVGQTKGFTCKRVGGEGSDSWTGKRVWDTVNLRPKHVFCRLPD
jgi:hypothetical protein